MDSPLTSSPTKMSLHSSVDDSQKEEEHDWDSYLIETNTEPAPAANFRQALIPPVNRFTEKNKFETIDPRNQDSWCIGTVIEKDGPRLRIRLDGTDDRNDFWRLVDSADIRCYGTAAKLNGQIVPPLGFQQNSSRWRKYFEKNVENGPFAHESCFEQQPPKPEKNFFKVGQKLEAVDPRHPNIICPATISNVSSSDRRIEISLDGWSSSNNFKVDYSSRDIFPVGWCKSAGIRIATVGGNFPSRSSNKTLPTTPNKQNGNTRQPQSKTKKTIISPLSNNSSYSPTTMDEKNNNLTTTKTSSTEKQRSSIGLNSSAHKDQPIVTVYFNYLGDNSGMLLNPQKFRFSMPSIFGPGESLTVLTSIFDSCIKCAFQQASFLQEILHTFARAKSEKKDCYTQLKLENGSIVYISQLETKTDFWDVIQTLQTAILSSNDLFISTPPVPLNNQSNGSFSSFLDSSTSPDKKESSPVHRSSINNNSKRKSTELGSYPDDKTFLSNEKTARSSLNEKSVYETKPSIEHSKSVANGVTGTSRRPERFTPNEVATFIRGIGPSFDSLAQRFLQEEIDGKALLLLTTDTLMRHMGLKLGPSLIIVHHIGQLKKC